MKKFLLFALLGILGILGKMGIANAASYPIAELGNCRDQTECFYYCQIPANQPACWSYGTYVLGPKVLGEATTSASIAGKEEYMRSHGITFPIPDLGNCASIVQCGDFCSQAANREACSRFAAAHGLIQSKPPAIDRETLLAKAKTALGCDSVDACKALCDTAENRQKCLDFSKSVGIPTPTPKPQFSVTIFDAAQRELGCDSLVACKEMCAKEENFQKCQFFSKAHNLAPKSETNHSISPPAGSTGQSGQLPCTSIESCSNLCREHKDICLQNQDLIRKITGSSPGSPTALSPTPSQNLSTGLYNKLHDSTGCQNDVECYTYCVTHYNACPGFPYQYYQLQPTQYPSPTGYTYPSPYPSYQYPTQYPTYYPNVSPYPTYSPSPTPIPGSTSGTSVNTTPHL